MNPTRRSRRMSSSSTNSSSVSSSSSFSTNGDVTELLFREYDVMSIRILPHRLSSVLVMRCRPLRSAKSSSQPSRHRHPTYVKASLQLYSYPPPRNPSADHQPQTFFSTAIPTSGPKFSRVCLRKRQKTLDRTSAELSPLWGCWSRQFCRLVCFPPQSHSPAPEAGHQKKSSPLSRVRNMGTKLTRNSSHCHHHRSLARVFTRGHRRVSCQTKTVRQTSESLEEERVDDLFKDKRLSPLISAEPRDDRYVSNVNRKYDGDGNPHFALAERSTSEYKYDVFIGHDDHDLAQASDIVHILRESGLTCFLMDQDLQSGFVIKQIDEAIASSRTVLLLLTSSSQANELYSFTIYTCLCEMYHRKRAMVVPVIKNIPEAEVPSFVRNLSLVDMCEPGYEEKLVQLLKGEEMPLSKLLPVGNVSHGLAWCYYLNYLRIILPSLGQRIDSWCQRKHPDVDVRMPRKLYALVPTSCHCPRTLTEADPGIEVDDELDPVRQSTAGSVDRVYKQTVYRIRKDSGEVLKFVVEYCNPVHTLAKMENHPNAGMNTQERRKQRDEFICILLQILAKFEFSRYVQIVPFSDRDDEGNALPLSEILTAYVERDIRSDSAANKAGLTSASNKARLTSAANKARLTSAANKAGLTSAANKARLTSASNKARLTSAANKARLTSAANKAGLTSAANKARLTSASNKARLISAANRAA